MDKKENEMKTKMILFSLLLSLLCGAGAAAQEKPGKSNLTVREWNIDAGTNQKILDHQTIYNENGKKVEETEYDSKGQKWRKKYEYSPDGVLLRVLTYDGSNKLDNIRKFEFNELGRKKTEYVYNSKGKLKRCKVYEYSYAAPGD